VNLTGEVDPSPSYGTIDQSTTHPDAMTYHLQSPAGEIAAFQQIAAEQMAFICGRDTVELPTVDARKVWKALLLCQWQRIDTEALLIWQGV
jgi:hypothetical protein